MKGRIKMKNKRLLKIALLVLAAATVLACLAGCGKTEKNVPKPPEPATEAGTDRLSDDMPERDMSHSLQEFVILNYTDAAHAYSIKIMAPTEDSGEELVQKIYRRNLAMEERYQVLISELQNDRPYDLIRNDWLVGKADYDAAMIYEEHVNRCLVAGALRLFEEIPYINLSKPWWNESANDIYSFQDHQYAGVGDWSISMYSKLHAYLFNKNMLASHPDSPDLYDLVRQKEWTIDEMFRIASDYIVDVEGEDNDIYGIVGTSKVHFQLLLTGAGQKYVEKTDDGYEFALTSQAADSLVSKLLDLSEQYYYNNNPGTYNGGVITAEFTSNRALMLAGMITTLESLGKDMSGIGVLPAPLLNEDQDDYHTIAVGGLLTCFPAATDPARLEEIGILTEALCCASYLDVLPVYQNKLLKGRRAEAPDDAEMMDVLFRTMSFDLGCSTWANDIRLNIMANVFHPLNKAYSSYFQTFEGTLGEAFDGTVSAILSRYIAVQNAKSEGQTEVTS